MSQKMKANSGGSKLVPVECFKCKASNDSRNTVLCAHCLNRYDFDCAGLSEKLYRLMSQDSRRKWKCKLCLEKRPCETSNVTLRRKPLKNTGPTVKKLICTTKGRSDSLCTPQNIPVPVTTLKTLTLDSDILTTDYSYTSRCSESELESTSKSLSSTPIKSHEREVKNDESDRSYDSPCFLSKSLDGSTIDAVLFLEMQEKNSQLTSTLISTQNELDNQILDNNELHRRIDKLSRENKLLISLCQSTPVEGRYDNINSIKKKRRSLAPRACSIPSIPSSPSVAGSNRREQITKLQVKIAELENLLNNAESQISELNNQLMIVTKRLGSSEKPPKIPTKKYKNTLKPKKQNKQARLCFVTSGRRYNILRNMDRCEYYSNFKRCNYIIPNVGVEILIRDIQKKICGFTKEDYCVIMIGETDFYETQDYMALVTRIRETLESLEHTNIIIAAPTYICGAPVYNSRVETFNTLLNRDIYNHHYAVFFDSNEELTLDLFSDFTGKIRNAGVQNILHHIARKISVLEMDNDIDIISMEDLDVPSKQPLHSVTRTEHNRHPFFRTSLSTCFTKI